MTSAQARQAKAFARREAGATWAAVAQELGVTPSGAMYLDKRHRQAMGLPLGRRVERTPAEEMPRGPITISANAIAGATTMDRHAWRVVESRGERP